MLKLKTFTIAKIPCTLRVITYKEVPIMVIGRKQVATLVAEFLGTGVLTLAFLSVMRSTIGIAYFIALAAGVAVAVTAYFFGDVSGSHMNPAITLALWTGRKIGSVMALLYLIFQTLGAWAAYGVFYYLQGNVKIQAIGGHYTFRVLLAEAIGAFIFALAWGVVTVRKMDGASRAFLLGATYAVAIVVASTAGVLAANNGVSAVTTGIINPAVALGVRAWAFAGSMGWGTFVLGPVLGALIGYNLYVLLFTDMKGGSKAVAAPATTSTSSSRAKKTTAKKKTSKR